MFVGILAQPFRNAIDDVQVGWCEKDCEKKSIYDFFMLWASVSILYEAHFKI